MTDLARNPIKYIILGVFFYFLIFLMSDIRSLLDVLSVFDYSKLAVAIALVVTGYLIRLMRWNFYMRGLSIKTKSSALVFFAGFSMTVTPAKLGEVLKSFLLKQSDKIPKARSLPAVIMERFGDVTGLSLLLILTSLSYGQHIAFFFLLLSVLTLIVLAKTNVAERVVNILMKKKAGRVREMKKNMNKLVTKKIIFYTLVTSAVTWLFECLALWLIVSGFGASIDLKTAVFIFSLSTIAGALSFLPGGLGVTEGSMYLLLVSASLAPNIALAAMLLVRLCTLWLAVFLGLISLYLFNRSIR